MPTRMFKQQDKVRKTKKIGLKNEANCYTVSKKDDLFRRQ